MNKKITYHFRSQTDNFIENNKLAVGRYLFDTEIYLSKIIRFIE